MIRVVLPVTIDMHASSDDLLHLLLNVAVLPFPFAGSTQCRHRSFLRRPFLALLLFFLIRLFLLLRRLILALVASFFVLLLILFRVLLSQWLGDLTK